MHIYRNGKSDRRDYELVPANFITPESASVNYTDLNQDLGQVPEEPKANSAQEGKPRCI